MPEFQPGAAVLNTESSVVEKNLKKIPVFFFEKKSGERKSGIFRSQNNRKNFWQFTKRFLLLKKFFKNFSAGKFPVNHLRSGASDSEFHSKNPPCSSHRSPLRGSRSQNRPSFHFRCHSTTQEDFRLPIACISPDFFLRREKNQSGARYGPGKNVIVPFSLNSPDFGCTGIFGLFQIAL